MNLAKLALRMPDEVWALFEPILPPVAYAGTGRKPCANRQRIVDLEGFGVRPRMTSRKVGGHRQRPRG